MRIGAAAPLGEINAINLVIGAASDDWERGYRNWRPVMSNKIIEMNRSVKLGKDILVGVY